MIYWVGRDSAKRNYVNKQSLNQQAYRREFQEGEWEESNVPLDTQ